VVAVDLLDRYGFERGAFSAEQLVGYWLRSYPAEWIRAAMLEALYQGRYKSVSVGQILAIWKRRGQPLHHYSFEFERMICGTLSRLPTTEAIAAERSTTHDSKNSEAIPPASQITLPSPHPMAGAARHPSPDSASPATAAPESAPDRTEPPDRTSAARAIAPDDRPAPQSGPTPAAPQATDDPSATASSAEAASGEQLPPRINTAATAVSEDCFYFATPLDWSRSELIRPPIHQFIPDNAGSLFYEKLRAVAHEQLN
jgi:hypothetical protein